MEDVLDLYAEPHLPNSGGRSRQGDPVRITHRMPSTVLRLLLAVRPGSLALPGSRGEMSCHCLFEDHSDSRFRGPESRTLHLSGQNQEPST